MLKKTKKILLSSVAISLLIAGVTVAATSCSSQTTNPTNGQNQNNTDKQDSSGTQKFNPNSSSSSGTSHPTTGTSSGTTSPDKSPTVSQSTGNKTASGSSTAGKNNSSSSSQSSNPSNVPPPTPVVNAELTWNCNGTDYVDIANTNNLPLSVTGLDAPVVSYYVTSTPLNVNNVEIQSNNQNAFEINNSIKQMLSTDTNGYIPMSITAQTNVNGKTITSKPLEVVFYNSNSVTTQSNEQKLFWIPMNYNQTVQSYGSPVAFKLLTNNVSLTNGEHLVLLRTVSSYNGVTTKYQEDLGTSIPENGLITLKLAEGYQQLQLCIMKDNQVVAESNVLTINATQKNYIDWNANGIVNSLLSVNNGSCTIDVQSNISNFSLSTSDIYYENSNTKNFWQPITNTPKDFNLEIQGNQICITNFAENFATSLKIVDPVTGVASKVLTLSSYLHPGQYSTQVSANGQVLNASNSYSYTLKDSNNVQLSFQELPRTSSDFSYQLQLFENNAWKTLNVTDNQYMFHPYNKGSYEFRIISSWANNLTSPSVTTYFTINLAPDLDQKTVAADSLALANWIKNPDNLKQMYTEFLKNNEQWFVDYLSAWGYGYHLFVTQQNISSIFDNWTLNVNKNGQVVMNADIISQLTAPQYRTNTILRFNPGDKFSISLPFFTQPNNVEQITSEINPVGYSQVKLSFNFTKIRRNDPTYSWAVMDKNNKLINRVCFNFHTLPTNLYQPLTLTHYAISCIPQYFDGLNPLSNQVINNFNN